MVCPESTPNTIGLITLDAKQAGKRSAVNPHAAFDEAGTGNGATSATAPVLDPTDGRGPGLRVMVRVEAPVMFRKEPATATPRTYSTAPAPDPSV